VLLPLLFIAGSWAVIGPNAFDIDATWRPRLPRWLVIAAAAAASLAIMAGTGASPFLYFQF
jgi:hypothetical protein